MVTSDLYNVSLTDDKLAILILGAKIIKKSLNDSRFKYTANFYPLETTGSLQEKLHYRWKRAVRTAGKPHDDYSPFP